MHLKIRYCVCVFGDSNSNGVLCSLPHAGLSPAWSRAWRSRRLSACCGECVKATPSSPAQRSRRAWRTPARWVSPEHTQSLVHLCFCLDKRTALWRWCDVSDAVWQSRGDLFVIQIMCLQAYKYHHMRVVAKDMVKKNYSKSWIFIILVFL